MTSSQSASENASVVGETQKLHRPPTRPSAPLPPVQYPRCLLAKNDGPNATAKPSTHDETLAAILPADLAQWALRRNGHPTCIASIAHLATRKGYKALVALFDHGCGTSLPSLAATLRGLGSPWAPSDCLSEIRRCLSQDTPNARTALTEAIRATGGVVRFNEAMIERILSTLPNATADDDEARAFRQTAYKLLASDGYPEHVVNASHVAALCERLSADPLDWREATAVARVLAHWRHPGAASALVNLILRDTRSDEPTAAEIQARWGAAEALEKLWLSDSERAQHRVTLERKAVRGRDAIHSACIRAVASLGPPSESFAKERITRFDTAPELQPSILIALARWGSTEALPTVLRATKSKVLAREATVALAQIMPNTSDEENAVWSALLRLAKNDFDPYVRAAAIGATESHRGWTGSEAKTLCHEVLRQDTNRSVRRACIHALKRLEDTGASDILLSVALDDLDPRVRTLAIRTIAQLPIDPEERHSIGRTIVSILETHIADDLPFAAMIRLLTSWGTLGAFDAVLRQALRHDRVDLRAAGIRGASKLPLDEAQRQQLAALLPGWAQDPNQEVQLATSFATGAIGGVDSLQMLLSDPDPRVRMAVLAGASGRPELLQSLPGLVCAADLIADPVPAVRVQAVLALSQLKRPDAVEWMARGLRDPYLARPLAEGFGRHGHADGLDALLDLFDRVPLVGIQYAVLRSVGELDLEEASNRTRQDKAIALLSDTLLHSNHRVLRSAAAYQFVRMRSWDLSMDQKTTLANTLSAALAGETERSVFRHLPVALGSLQRPETVPELATLARSQQPYVRAAAARGLAYHPHHSGVEGILRRMARSDPSAFVRQTIHNITENRGAKHVRE